MAGLAATLNAPGSIEDLTAALAPAGVDGATCCLDGPDGGRLEIGVCAVLPVIPRVADEHGRTVAALAMDGVASMTALDGAYVADGPAGLLGGEDSYVVILADIERGELVLARNGDGPGLYYARSGDGWLVASEPSALISAGVPAEPDAEVIRRFVATGECDDTEVTFFAKVWRVLPNQVVVLSGPLRDGTVGGRQGSATSPRRGSWLKGMPDALSSNRVGVLLAPGLPGAAVLGAGLAGADRSEPLAVHTVTFPTLAGPASLTPSVLDALPAGAVRNAVHELDPHEIDLVAFLREVGEPVPDLDLYLLWAVVRDLTGEVDVLVDASLGDPACVSRVSDRLLSRYGVTVRCPLRGMDVDDLGTTAGGTLPAAIVQQAAGDPARSISASEFLRCQLDLVAATLARPRPWADHVANVGYLRRMMSAKAVDAAALLRAYIVECWLSTWDIPAEPIALPEEPGRPADVDLDKATWGRVPVRTPALTPGDRLAAAVGWHVADAVARLCAGDGVLGPWFAAVSAKAVAVSQRRFSPLWQIRPGVLARILSRMARRRMPRLGDPWTMQVAIEEGGLVRVAASAMAARLGLWWWARRILPDEAALVSPARTDAVPPADAAVVRSPLRADEAAAVVLEALRHSLTPDQLAALAGCAVVAADEEGSRVVGFAPGPCVDSVPFAEEVVAELLADNPCGQGREQTPIVLALQTPNHLDQGAHHPRGLAVAEAT